MFEKPSTIVNKKKFLEKKKLPDKQKCFATQNFEWRILKDYARGMKQSIVYTRLLPTILPNGPNKTTKQLKDSNRAALLERSQCFVQNILYFCE